MLCRRAKELPLAGVVPRRAREFTDTVAKPLDSGALSLVGNAHAGEGARGGALTFLLRSLWVANFTCGLRRRVLRLLGAELKEEREEKKCDLGFGSDRCGWGF
jgi:hypothetical protein